MALTKGEQTALVEFEGQEVEVPRDEVTGAELMALLGVNPAEGLIEILDDGTQRQVRQEDTFNLRKGPRFKRRPKFKRG